MSCKAICRLRASIECICAMSSCEERWGDIPASCAPDSTRLTQHRHTPSRIVPFHLDILGAHSSMTTMRARTEDNRNEGVAGFSGAGLSGCTSCCTRTLVR